MSARLLAYERDPSLTELEARVVEAGREGERDFAVLDDTVFYPEGGGQPADKGTINGVEVTDVQKRGGEVRHYVASPLAPGPAALRLDAARRFDHMQQHTGQHLLSAVAEDRFGWRTTAFHLGASVCDVELDVPAISAAERRALEEAVAAEIRAARPVHVRRVALEEMADLPVRTRGLPEGHAGDVRHVEIEGVDLNTCGGTHLRSTAEIESVALLSSERVRGGTRLFFVCGGRVRRRLAEDEERNASLRALFGAADAELASVAGAKLEQLASSERSVKKLEEELAASLADSLAAEGGAVLERHLEGRDLAFLQQVARRVSSRARRTLLFLTGSKDGAHAFVLSAGEDLAVDVAALGREVAGFLGGRGGGSGRVFQGKAASFDARERAVDALRSRSLRGPDVDAPPRAV
jgi:alanyl-tRNA synthetase